MEVKTIWIPSRAEFNLLAKEKSEKDGPSGVEYQLKLIESEKDELLFPGLENADVHWEHFIKVASLANVAYVAMNQDGNWITRGDPTGKLNILALDNFET